MALEGGTQDTGAEGAEGRRRVAGAEGAEGGSQGAGAEAEGGGYKDWKTAPLFGKNDWSRLLPCGADSSSRALV